MLGAAHCLEGDEADALEAAGVREAHQVQALYFATVAPVVPHLVFLAGRQAGKFSLRVSSSVPL